MLFKKGYNELNNKLDKHSRFVMSCYNCDSFYKTEEDEEEVCQNPNVLKYDMVVSENCVYCNHWKPCKGNSKEAVPKTPKAPSVKSIFKKRGERSE